MNVSEQIICCDWGTSNFRLYLVVKESGEILEEYADSDGIAKVNSSWKGNSTVEKVEFFRSFLEQKLEDISKTRKRTLANLDVVLSGMASSSLGMIEVPYTSLPFNLNIPKLNVNYLKKTNAYHNDLYVFGGIKSNHDIIRGEEIQILGLKDLLSIKKYLCILPGTHSKHLFIDKEEVLSFNTFMTGEIYGLLKEKSVLKNSLSTKEEFSLQDKAYIDGIREGSEQNLLGSLFKVRANQILHNVDKVANESYLSGLVIGAELKAVMGYKGPIVLGGSGVFSALYARALEFLKPDFELIRIDDQDMRKAVPKGQLFLMNKLKVKK